MPTNEVSIVEHSSNVPVVSVTENVRQKGHNRGAHWMEEHPAILLAAILCSALLLRLAMLGTSSLWLDEIWSIGIARFPFSGLVSVIRNQDPNMSVYYALLHVWMKLSSGEAFVRSLSALFGTGAVWAVYALGKRLFNKNVALIASALLALNAFHLQWSQEARSYSLLVLLVTLSCWSFVMNVEASQRKWSVLHVVTSVLALYAHIYALLVIIAQCLSLLFLRPSRVPWKRLFTNLITTAILSLPLGLLILDRARHPWLPMDWLTKPTIHSIYDMFYALAGNADFAGSHGGKLVLAAYALACSAAIWKCLDSGETETKEVERLRWRTALLVLWLIAPIALAFCISLVQPMFLNRYLLMCVPALVLLGAQGLTSIRSRSLSGLAVVVLALLAAQRLPQYYQHRHDFQQWKEVTRYVATQARPGDAIVYCVAPGRLLFDYYKHKYQNPIRSYPEPIYPAAFDENQNPRVLDYLPSFNSAALQQAAASHPRTWLILYHDTFATTERARDTIEAALAHDYTSKEHTKFSGVNVFVYSNKSAQELSAHR